MAFTTPGSNRDPLVDLAVADRDQLIKQDVLVGDPRRWRPRWFDGRFLAASDLQAEQNYFLVRQADLGRAGGAGVLDGLLVSSFVDASTGAEQLRIEPGEGVTDTGELVVIFDPLTVSPADVPEMQRLDAAFGLQVIPNEGGRTRTGLYILALRPVEWTANPIGAYPTSLTGTRKVEDSTIVEGAAVSLIPYPQQGTDDSWARRRASVAREIFVDGRDRGLVSGVLPLAMVALRGNFIEWVDPFLVRRETGAERPAGIDFGFGARALREAHLLQYQRHLADTMNANNDLPFVATSYFDALPPIGQFPSATLDADALTQRFFPPGISVDLSFVPEDELAALIEESLLLPPIDLTVATEQLAGTTVVVLVPLSRADFATNQSALPNWDTDPPQLTGVIADIRALATPRALLLSRFFAPATPPATDTVDRPWQQLLRNALGEPLLWYVRRRHLPIPTNVAGTSVDGGSSTIAQPRVLTRLIASDAPLANRINRLGTMNVPEVATLSRRLAERRFVDNPALLRSIVARAAGPEGATPSPSTAVAALAATTDPDAGKGLDALTTESAALGRTLHSDRIIEAGVLPEIDRLARDTPADQLSDLATELRTALKANEDVEANVATLRRKFVPGP